MVMDEMKTVDEKMLFALSEQVGNSLKQRGWMLVTAESCTGGWVGEEVTAVAGSSHWYDRGFITYTNTAKEEMLGVSQKTLEAFGAVSEQTVSEMVTGALKNSHAQIGLAISGIAGPGGATPTKPLGTVCLAWGTKGGEVKSVTRQFDGDRQQVRAQAVAAALTGVLEILQEIGA